MVGSGSVFSELFDGAKASAHFFTQADVVGQEHVGLEAQVKGQHPHLFDFDGIRLSYIQDPGFYFFIYFPTNAPGEDQDVTHECTFQDANAFGEDFGFLVIGIAGFIQGDPIPINLHQ